MEEEPSHQLQRQSEEGKKSKFQLVTTWMVLFAAELFGGFTFSLLAPFYTKEATSKGISVAQSGLVYGSVFLTTLVCTPICGKILGKVSSKTVFLAGTLLSGAANVAFGQIQWVQDPTLFLVLSVLVRMLSAVGETAFFAAAFPLAVKSSGQGRSSVALSSLETLYGVGLTLGPLLGGFLYETDGFYLPFTVCGSCLTLCGLLGCIFLRNGGAAGNNNSRIDKSRSSNIERDARSDDAIVVGAAKVGYRSLARMPTVVYCCLTLILSGISASWYLPSLQPFLEDKYHLGTTATGVVLMLDGAAYAIFSPLWGFLLDRKVSPVLALLCGNVTMLLGYFLMGPVHFLLGDDQTPTSPWLVALGMAVHGFGLSANFITTLTFLISSATTEAASIININNNNLSEEERKQRHGKGVEKSRGLATSIWLMQECLGSYIGSACGGLAYDRMGFEQGTLVVVAMQIIALTSLPIFKYLLTRRNRIEETSTPNEATPLLA